MPDIPEAASPATAPAETSDAFGSGRSGNVSVDQAAAQLFANAEKQATLQPVPQAAEETAVPKGESTTEESAAEAVAASAVAPHEETAPAESEPEADAVLSQTSQFTPEQQKIFDKRVGKEMGRRQSEETRRKESDAKVEALEARLAELQATPPVAPPVAAPLTPASALTGHKLVDDARTPAELETLSDNATTAIGFVEDALDDPNLGHDLTDTINVSGKEWTRGELIGLRKNAREALAAIPKKARMFHQQAQFFSEKQRVAQIAHKEFPFLADKKTPEYQQAQAMLRDPWIAMRPDAEWIVGVQIRGLAAMEAAKNATKAEAEKPKPKAPPAAKPSADQATVSTAGTATRSPGSDSKARQAMLAEREKLNGKKGITAADAVAHLTRIEQSRNSR